MRMVMEFRDFSAGLLAFGIDLSGRTGQYFSLLPPIDPEWQFH